MSSRAHHLRFGERSLEIHVAGHAPAFRVELPEEAHEVVLLGARGGELVLASGDRVIAGHVRSVKGGIEVSWRGRTWRFELMTPGAPTGEVAGAAASDVVAPMTGRIIEILCREGDEVEAGRPLAIVEAMKMEHRLAAPVRSRVTRVLAAADQQVEIGETLIELEPLPEEP